MPQRSSIRTFLNKEHFELIMSMLEVFIDGVEESDPRYHTALDLEKKLEMASDNKRFSIEVENTNEVVPTTEELRRQRMGFAKRPKGTRGVDLRNPRRTPNLQR